MFTSFYSFRIIYLTFLSKPNAFKNIMANVHELPIRMAIVLSILSIGSIFLGFFLKDLFFNTTGINYTF
jgi:NADH-ubiquinone oxidoreductase chain 5